MIEDFIRDVKHRTRRIRANVVFSAILTATLAVAIGATVTVFSAVDAWLVRPLNSPGPDRL